MGDCNDLLVLRTIDRIDFAGKWAEIWFREGPLPDSPPLRFHHCEKSEVLFDAIGEAGLATEMYNIGVSGMMVGIGRDESGVNWKIKRVLQTARQQNVVEEVA